MATKTYRSIGSIVNLLLYIDGQNVPVNFYPVSNYEAGRGGSRYVTDNEAIQKALESRFDYGQMFYLEKDEKHEYDEVGTPIADLQSQETEVKKTLEIVKVDSVQTAKTYLVEHYGWKPSGRVSAQKIVEAAENYGIQFEGIA